MVLSMAAFTAVVTVPRQTLSALSGTEALGYYATVATPVVVIQVLVTGIFDPVLRSAAESWEAGDTARLKALGLRLLLILGAITAAAFLLGAYLGEWALVLLYGEGIRSCSGLLLPVIGCAALYCLCWIVSTMLVIMRRLGVQLVISLAALALSAALGRPLLDAAGLNGVSYAVLGGYGLYLLSGGAAILHILRRENGTIGEKA